MFVERKEISGPNGDAIKYKSKKQQMLSPAQLMASLNEEERTALLSSLDPSVKAELKYHWPFWARPNQLEPEGNWTTWLILAGRGFGKSRVWC
jgi:phage terminase large subunit-like protein